MKVIKEQFANSRLALFHEKLTGEKMLPSSPDPAFKLYFAYHFANLQQSDESPDLTAMHQYMEERMCADIIEEEFSYDVEEVVTTIARNGLRDPSALNELYLPRRLGSAVMVRL